MHVGVTMCSIASRVMNDSSRCGSLLDRALMIDRSALAVVPACSPNSRVGGAVVCTVQGAAQLTVAQSPMPCPGTVRWRCDAIPCPSPPAITPGKAPCHAHSGQRARVAGRPAHKARAGTNKQALKGGFPSQRTKAGTAQRARKLAVGSFTGARPASARDSLEVTGPARARALLGTDADRPEGGTDGVPAAGRRVRPPPQAASARIPSGPRPTSTSCGMDRRLPRSLGSRHGAAPQTAAVSAGGLTRASHLPAGAAPTNTTELWLLGGSFLFDACLCACAWLVSSFSFHCTVFT